MVFERPFLLFVIPLVSIGLGLVYASFEVTMNPYRQVEVPSTELALLIKTDGPVELSRFHTRRSSPLPEGEGLEISLFHLDKVQTRLRSKATLSFLDGYELEFEPKSLFVIEQWNPEEQSGPIYINLISGDFRVTKAGQPGSLYVVKNGAIFDPNRKPKPSGRMLVLKQPAPLSRGGEVAATEPETAPPTPTVLETERLLATLSNEYIDSTIAKNRDQFVKCQQNALRQDRAATGQLLVGIAIEPRGVMKDVRVLASDIENPELHTCVTRVLERTQFRSFNGPEIVRSYPLVFE